MKTTQPESEYVCPVTLEATQASCPLYSCMHNDQGACRHSAMLSLEGDQQATANFFGIKIQQVADRVQDIQVAIVASKWFEHIIGKPLVDGSSADFNAALDAKQMAEYRTWNKTKYHFSQIIATLRTLQNRL